MLITTFCLKSCLVVSDTLDNIIHVMVEQITEFVETDIDEYQLQLYFFWKKGRWLFLLWLVYTEDHNFNNCQF